MPHKNNTPKKAKFRRKRLYRKFLPIVKRFLFYLFVLVLVISISFGFYYMFFISNYLKVSEVRVSGAKNFVNSVDLKNVAQEQLAGSNILFVKTTSLSNMLEANFQGAEDIVIKRKLPSTVNIIVYERVPLALVFRDSDYFMIDQDGYVLGIVDREKTNLPEIRYEGNIKVGHFIDENLVPVYLEVMDALLEEPIKVSSMSFYPKYVKLFMEDDIIVLLDRKKDRDKSIKIVKEIMAQMELEQKKVRKIDLRYDKVVVSF